MGMIFGIIKEEMPRYEVLSKNSNREVRRYTDSLVAVCTTEKYPGDSGFSRLAGYIGVLSSPQNAAGEKIAMTAPVVTRPLEIKENEVVRSSKKDEMEFILPSKVTWGNAPQPTNPSVFEKGGAKDLCSNSFFWSLDYGEI